jgi:hypothetical protein
MIQAIFKSIRPLLSRPNNHMPPTKKHNLSIPEIVTLAIFRFFTGHRNWKDFYRHLVTYHRNDFPSLPAYKNFLIAVNGCAGFATFLLQGFVNLFRIHTPDDTLKFADSTKLKVCEIFRSLSHKVAKGVASKSKTRTGWFYGFRLHIVINPWLEILGIRITTATQDERRALASMWDNFLGMIVADAGYIGKEWAAKAREGGKILFAAVRANMKKLMTEAQHRLFKERQKVEVVFATLKLRFGIETTLPRSVFGYFAHYLFALTAYQLKRLLDGRKNGLTELISA